MSAKSLLNRSFTIMIAQRCECATSASVKGRPGSRKVAASGRSGSGVSVPPTNGANGCLRRGIFLTDAVLLKQTEVWRDYARPAHLEQE